MIRGLVIWTICFGTLAGCAEGELALSGDAGSAVDAWVELGPGDAGVDGDSLSTDVEGGGLGDALADSDAVEEDAAEVDLPDVSEPDLTPPVDVLPPEDLAPPGDVPPLEDVSPPEDVPSLEDVPPPEPDVGPDLVEEDAVAATGSCCESQDGPSCESSACSAAVCALDDYCCETKWDLYCVACAQGLESWDGQSCAGPGAVCGCEAPEPVPANHVALAEHWAPVWFHDTDDTHYEADYIVAYDFDGDTVSGNNWENLDEPFVDLGAVVYFAVIETSTHWFIYYLDFHPRDWTEDCDPLLWWLEPCHENDLEGAMVAIRNDGSEFGVFEVLYTEAHNTLHVATNDPAITAASTPNLEDVPVTFEGGSHVELYVESKGHGVCPLYYDGDSHCEHPTDGNPPAFPGGDGVVYRYSSGEAEMPESGSDPNVSYALVSFYDTLWKQRYDVCDSGCTFDQPFSYGAAQIGGAFDGDTWGEDKAMPPWSWDDPDDGAVYAGDWFFDPAGSMVTHLSVPGDVSLIYVHNPYVDELWPAGAP